MGISNRKLVTESVNKIGWSIFVMMLPRKRLMAEMLFVFTRRNFHFVYFVGIRTDDVCYNKKSDYACPN